MTFRAFEGQSSNLPQTISFRPIVDNDLEFLKALYASTRAQEMKLVDWPAEQKALFLASQFDAQHSFYMEQFQSAAFLLVEQQGRPIGRVYVDRREQEIRLIDIALINTSRNQGLGGGLLRELLREGQESRLPVSIHVEKNNPAMQLYLRLGFAAVEDQGVYELMRWQPD